MNILDELDERFSEIFDNKPQPKCKLATRRSIEEIHEERRLNRELYDYDYEMID